MLRCDRSAKAGDVFFPEASHAIDAGQSRDTKVASTELTLLRCDLLNIVRGWSGITMTRDALNRV